MIRELRMCHSINLEDLACNIAQEMSVEEVRRFIDMICDEFQEYELDAGIYSDRVRDMKKCLDEGEVFSHEQTLINFPELETTE